MKRATLVGRRFTKLVVVGVQGAYATCACDCGNEVRIWKANLYRDNTRSCGCIKKTADGMSRLFPVEYQAWSGMIERCSDQSFKQWRDYGGRGITVCEEWKNSFAQFLADMGPRPAPKMSLDRRNTNGNYEPTNCRWATSIEQMRNTRRNRFITINGKTQTFSAWIKEVGINPSTFYKRLRRGVSPGQALAK